MAEFPSEAFGLIVKVADMLRKGTPIKDKLTVGNLVMQSVLSITKLIEQQQQKIEQLKCCGNCGNWEQFDEFGSEKIHNCIANKKLTWRERFDKCDKWEAAGNG